MYNGKIIEIYATSKIYYIRILSLETNCSNKYSDLNIL